MRGDRSFEQQFQWEVDRWVFRYRHRGGPIEVTREERDRLVGRHEARMLFGSRLLKLGIFAIFALCFAFPGAIGVLFIWMIVVKWAEETSQRARDRKLEEIRRARDLGSRAS